MSDQGRTPEAPAPPPSADNANGAAGRQTGASEQRATVDTTGNGAAVTRGAGQDRLLNVITGDNGANGDGAGLTERIATLADTNPDGASLNGGTVAGPTEAAGPSGDQKAEAEPDPNSKEGKRLAADRRHRDALLKQKENSPRWANFKKDMLRLGHASQDFISDAAAWAFKQKNKALGIGAGGGAGYLLLTTPAGPVTLGALPAIAVVAGSAVGGTVVGGALAYAGESIVAHGIHKAANAGRYAELIGLHVADAVRGILDLVNKPDTATAGNLDEVSKRLSPEKVQAIVDRIRYNRQRSKTMGSARARIDSFWGRESYRGKIRKRDAILATKKDILTNKQYQQQAAARGGA